MAVPPSSGSRALRLAAPLAAAAALCAAPAQAQFQGYYTHPDIADGLIVFAAEGDLWTVPEAGGNATRLTSSPGEEYSPRFSPDGSMIAFTAQYEGNRDVYVVSAQGGEPRRLTWHGYRDEVSGWSPDGKFIHYQSVRGDAHYSMHTWRVPVEGGPSEQLPLGPACFTDMAPDGETVVFNRVGSQRATWKRYGGGLSDDIWRGNPKTQQFEKLTTFFGNDQSPHIIGDRVYFGSERDGRMNLWSLRLRGGDLKQHTSNTEFDVRFLTGDSQGKLVYQQGADIAVYDTASGTQSVVPVTLKSDRPEARPRFASASTNLESGDLANNGERALVSTRGDIFNVPFGSGRAITLEASSGSRERYASFAGDEDQFAVYASDRTGEYEIHKRDARTGKDGTQITKRGDGRLGNYIYGLAVSPDGDKVAFSDETGALYFTGLTTQTIERVAKSDVWELRDYSWSPDSRYIAYASYQRNEYSRVFVYDLESKTSTPVTDPHLSSQNPAWDPEGKYLFFLSDRSFNPWNGRVDYETIMAPMTRPYGIALQADGKNPFLPPDPYEAADEAEAKKEEEKKKKEEEKKKAEDEKKAEEAKSGDAKEGEAKDEDSKAEGDEAAEEDGKEEEKEEDEKAKIEPIKIDFEGITNRTFAFPGEPQDLGGLMAAKGRVFYSSYPLRGRNEEAHGVGEPDEATLLTFDYTDHENEEEDFGAGITSYGMSRNQEHLWYRTAAGLYVAPASAAKADPEAKTARIDEIRVRVNPTEEWAQIVEECYRLNRDFFYLRDMAGVDWRAMADRYKGLLPRIANRNDLNDVLGNLIGELGHGHTYVMGGGDYGRGATPVPTGQLGANFELDKAAGKWRFADVHTGDRWLMDGVAPLGRHGVAVNPGDYLLAVDGEEVRADREVYSYFWGKAGVETEIAVNSKPELEGARRYRIVPAAEDGGVYYHSWVERNRRYVDVQSGGEIGYIHIPDMDGPGLVSFFRQWYPQLDKKAMVIDDRYNGGGNVSQLILHRLRRTLLAVGMSAQFDEGNSTYPSKVFTGPMACLINQGSASDGDIFPYMFRKSKLGPLIGTRTWGGVVGIRSDKPFVDGGLVTIPEFTEWDESGFYVENFGVEPDIEVDITPADFVAGRDPQLDRALEYLKGEMGKDKYKRPARPAKNPDRSTENFRDRARDYMRKP